ncbi:type VI secretion system tube protein TssD [Lacinutrix sp. 5H-3-7-4]|uniref:type VI secretion system tube protein TssD n=1 Tax=Lacinutrix sp. (strain 5H-3-7-4) TaxID=983544 RepID=UPI00020A38F6|nr:type VI secretion system tube protein TssD [Lacinutrix sp. 5H-3-7-4]AEH02114.1 hypothetical protein Lacal_2271 [Lacinutrix sp. 5H-3-7-4]
MSFKTRLNVGGKEYNVLSCDYKLHQETDPTGRPSSITRGGQIKISVESTSDTSLSDWMFNNFERKDGSLTFFKRDTDAKAKELNFTEAYMIEYTEVFDHKGDDPMTETIVISAKSISIGNGEHVNEWV